MPSRVTDKCHHLCHKIQDLINSETILPPLKESSTLSNHHINYINASSTIFDPTHYIIPAHLPKPIVPILVESSISVLEFEPTMEQTELKELRKAVEEMGHKMDTQMIQIGFLTQKMDSLLTFLISDPSLKQNAKEDMDEGRSPPKMKLSKIFKGLFEASETCNTCKDSVKGTTGTTMSPRLNRSAKSRTSSRFSTPQSLVYGELLKAGLIKPLPLAPLPQKFSASHNPSTFCIFHQMPGHNTNDYIRLCHAIKDLIEKRSLRHLLNQS
ncbi:hypothetical protein RHMOL_Rhmol11G0005700 [Rhododendron molle]|uniref:Uncharacterized protein n=1 Tax=Rhododendron molle TaxID=49168 RepID=A0ACC0LM88_RHOML|nr:hypothetical protein RHMOL_Rhmol11G0005700 [Rhododendron molle]